MKYKIFSRNITHIALDVYGTILAVDEVDDSEIFFGAREGTREFLEECKKPDSGVEVVCASDAVPAELEFTMRDAGLLKEGETLNDIFYDIVTLRTTPKDYSVLLEKYWIDGHNLLVVGDREEKEIEGAEMIGANWILVPEYSIKNRMKESYRFNMMDILKFI